MPLTKSFKDLVKSRADADPAFRRALLVEGIDTLLAGEVDVGLAVLRDYVNATLGFAALAERTGLPSKSLMRMLGPTGNPAARNLFAVISALRTHEGLNGDVDPGDAATPMVPGVRVEGRAA